MTSLSSSMALIRVLLGRSRLLRSAGRTAAFSAQTELDLDARNRVRLLNKIDPSADQEPDAIMEQLRGGDLFSDPYPPGSLLHRLTMLLERSEAGDAAAIAQLESTVAGLEPAEKLLFYRLREQFMGTKLESIEAEDVPAPASDDDWRRIMADAVEQFQKIGQHLQQVEAEKKRRATIEAAPIHSERNDPAKDEAETEPSEANGSASPATEERSASAQLYTDRADIHEHTDQDIMRFFDFDTTLLPEGLAGTIDDEFALTKTPKLLIRSTSYRIMARCRALGQDDGYQPGTTVVLAGSTPGSGRSSALNYVAAWARSRPYWITVFVPEPARFSQSGKRIIRSRRHPDLFTQPDLQREWLGELLQRHGDLLATVPLVNKINDLQTLRDLVQYGADHEDTDDLIFDVFAELRTATSCRVMIAIDGYNLWLRQSAYSDPDTMKPLMGPQLALVRCLLDFYDKAPDAGVTIVTTTTTAAAPATASLKREAGPSTEIVTMPIYSGAEFDTVIGHWIQSGWLIDIPEELPKFKDYVSALSGRCPRDLVRVLQSL